MKANILLFFIIIINISIVYGQDTYQQGYFIKNNGEKVNCLIKNMDWENNPTSFYYKLSESSPKERAYIEQVTEFEIVNFSKYQRFKVKIDTSGSEPRYLSDNQTPEYEERIVFLKILVSGKANLYFYHRVNMNRFFIQTDSLPIEQLIYKKYLDKDDLQKYNNLYKSQLMKNLKCDKLTPQEFIRAEYNTKSLTNIFLKYNACFGQETVNYVSKPKRKILNLGIRTGLNIASIKMSGGNSGVFNATFEKFMTPRIGLSGEAILPFGNNKWSVLFEPNFHYHNLKQDFNVQFGTKEIAETKFNAIEVPITIRYGIYVAKNAKMFLNTSYVFDIPIKKSKIDFDGRTDIKITTSSSVAFGVGMEYSSKYNFEFRYNFKRDLLNKYIYINADYSTINFIFGYNFLRK
ncbi:MAG: PorT family protein [Raineya sp.]|jgi:hypothetical protein|nr:PorT family protein [Raineya sp.]